MPDETDELIEPRDDDRAEDQSAQPSAAPPAAPPTRAPRSTPLDPNDEIPVPVAMEPAEIDERAQAVEAMRENRAATDEPAPPA